MKGKQNNPWSNEELPILQKARLSTWSFYIPEDDNSLQNLFGVKWSTKGWKTDAFWSSMIMYSKMHFEFLTGQRIKLADWILIMFCAMHKCILSAFVVNRCLHLGLGCFSWSCCFKCMELLSISWVVLCVDLTLLFSIPRAEASLESWFINTR